MKPARVIINCVVTRNKKQSHKSDINCDTINETQSRGDKSCQPGADILLTPHTSIHLAVHCLMSRG